MVFCALLLTLGGCAGTPPSKFYMLESISGSRHRRKVQRSTNAISIGLGPVTLPDYVDRPQIVTRTSQNTVQLAEFDRWAEPLSSNVSRTLTENLTSLLPTDSVVPYPWPGSTDVTYQVVVDVYRFDGILGEKAFLDAQWSVLAKKGKKDAGVEKVNLCCARWRAFLRDPRYRPRAGPSVNLSREIALALRASASGEN